MDEESMMEMWMNQVPTFGEVSPDYGEIEDYKESEHYPTSQLSNVETTSDLSLATFHDSSLSSDHGRNVATASEGLEGPPMILTPPASPDQPGMQDAAKDVMVDVPSHEIGS